MSRETISLREKIQLETIAYRETFKEKLDGTQ